MPLNISKPADWFDKVVHETVAQHPEKVGGFEGKISFTITGDAGGEWVVAFAENKVQVSTGADPTAPFALKMKDEHFVKMMNGELSGPTAFMTGKMKFKPSRPPRATPPHEIPPYPLAHCVNSTLVTVISASVAC